MNYRRRPWCSDHRQLVTLLMTLLGKRTGSCRQADRLVRLISKCNRTLSKISSPSICVELSRFPQNCFSRTLHTVWLNLDHESTGPHLASINTSLSSRSGTCARKKWSTRCLSVYPEWSACVFEYLAQSGQAVVVVILRARLQNYRTVNLRSICSEKKTYFRTSRVTLPRQVSCADRTEGS